VPQHVDFEESNVYIVSLPKAAATPGKHQKFAPHPATGIGSMTARNWYVPN
jgi:hypothetical protein